MPKDEEVELTYSLQISSNKKSIKLTVKSNDLITYDDLRDVIDKLESDSENPSNDNRH